MSGLLIYVNSPNRNKKALELESNNNSEVYNKIKSHPSENALDNYPFKYTINNDEDDENIENQLKRIIQLALKRFKNQRKLKNFLFS